MRDKVDISTPVDKQSRVLRHNLFEAKPATTLETLTLLYFSGHLSGLAHALLRFPVQFGTRDESLKVIVIRFARLGLEGPNKR